MRMVVSLLIMVLILFLGSCSFYVDPEGLPEFESVEDSIYWIQENINGEMDGTVYPINEILENRAGGCTAFAGLFLYVLKEQFGENALIAITIKNGYGHTIVYWNGVYYDLTNRENYIVADPVVLYYWTLEYYNFRASF